MKAVTLNDDGSADVTLGEHHLHLTARTVSELSAVARRVTDSAGTLAEQVAAELMACFALGAFEAMDALKE